MKTAYDKLLREAGRCGSEHDPTALLWLFAELMRWHQRPQGPINGCWFCRLMVEVEALAKDHATKAALLDGRTVG